MFIFICIRETWSQSVCWSLKGVVSRPHKLIFPSILFFIGVDEFAAITLKYSGERVAQLSCSIGIDLVNEAVVFGTKGQLKLPYPFWCSTKVETPTVSTSICTCIHCTNSYSVGGSKRACVPSFLGLSEGEGKALYALFAHAR